MYAALMAQSFDGDIASLVTSRKCKVKCRLSMHIRRKIDQACAPVYRKYLYLSHITHASSSWCLKRRKRGDFVPALARSNALKVLLAAHATFTKRHVHYDEEI